MDYAPKRKASKIGNDAFERMLGHRARHTELVLFRSVYWASYLLIVGGLLLFYGLSGAQVSYPVFFGYALCVLAMMVIVYGSVETLHHKLMSRHA
ncbi:Uncharacterised protein [uncultured archaeon]|nr:Uncharacterised protein [uncultured archaeon]